MTKAVVTQETGLETAELTESERRRLADCEARLERFGAAWLEAAEALREIRDRKLYRERYGSFEAYCEDRSFSRRHGYRLVTAAEVRGRILPSIECDPMGHIAAPSSERQLRELGRLPKGQQAEAWRQAVQAAPDGRPSGADVAAVVATIKGSRAKNGSVQSAESPGSPVERPEREPDAAGADDDETDETEEDVCSTDIVSRLRTELAEAVAERDQAIARAEAAEGRLAEIQSRPEPVDLAGVVASAAGCGDQLDRQLATERRLRADLERKLKTAEKRWQFLAAKTEKLQAELSSVRAHNARFSEPESTISGEAG